MALVGNFIPKPAMLSMPISLLQKPKNMIVCSTPDRPKTRRGGGGKINTTVRLSKMTIIGVKEVTPNTTLDVAEANHKSKENIADHAAAAAAAATVDATEAAA